MLKLSKDLSLPDDAVRVEVFAVLCTRPDGHQWLAHGNPGVATFYERKKAAEFAKALRPHVERSKVKVVKASLVVSR